MEGLTEHLDWADLLIYSFWIFFALLIFHLQMEARREGYPLESDETGKVERMPMIYVPEPKTFRLAHGHGAVVKPDGRRETRSLNLRSIFVWGGSPKVPTGNPMIDGIGPAAYAERADVPDLTHKGEVKIVPMRLAGEHSIADGDPNPVGMDVKGCDRVTAGKVVDVWIDKTENLIRYYEVQTGDKAGSRTVLLPAGFAIVRGRTLRHLHVHAMTAAQFADVPATRSPDQVTLLEEDKICGYFGGGLLYATPRRQEPLL